MTQIEQPVLQVGEFSNLALAACFVALLPEELGSIEECSTQAVMVRSVKGRLH